MSTRARKDVDMSVDAETATGATASHEARIVTVLPSHVAPTQDDFDPAPLIPTDSGLDWQRWFNSWFIRAVAVLIAVGIWHLLTEYNFNYIMNFENVPEPLVAAENFIHHLGTRQFFIHIAVSVKRILIGFGFAVVLGMLVGLLMGRSRLAEDLLIPYIEVLRPIPAVAWIPMSILMWPTEESSIVYITFLGAFFPIVLNTIHGAEQTPEVLVRAAQSLGAGRLTIFWHVVIPAALPSIAAGFSIGMGVSWFSLLAGEIISGQYGIGYFTWNAYSLIQYPDIVVGMLCIGALGTASTWLVRLATKPFLRWQTLELAK